MSQLSIVIPAYNEEQRLPNTIDVLQAWARDNAETCEIKEVLVIDDGSRDGTADYVKNRARAWSILKVVSLPQNQGKGAAVHRGMQEATSEWILIADADMATPWEEIKVVLSQAQRAELVMGSRALSGSHIIKRQHWFRQNMGKTFNRLLKTIMGLPFQDTQCGFKLVRNDHSFRSKILPFLEVQRFAWDVELILFFLREKKNVQEVPVRWEHKDQSRVHIVRDSFEMLFTVLKLKIKRFFR